MATNESRVKGGASASGSAQEQRDREQERADARADARADEQADVTPSFIKGPAKEFESADARLAAADEIVTRNSRWAGGLGFIPAPVIDYIAVTGFQVKMVRELCSFYGQPFSEERAKTWITALITASAPTTIGLPLASMMKAIPIVGSVASLLAMPAVSYATTFAVGRVFTRHFEEGGTLLTLDPKKSQAYYQEMFSQGTRRRQANA